MQLFFGLVRTKWPSSYYSSSEVFVETISQTWYRYFLFRFGPVLVAALLVALTGADDPAQVLTSVVIFGLVHGFATVGRALVLSAFRKSLTVRQVVVDLAVFVLIVLVCLLGGLVSPALRRYVPGFDKYVEVLLTGAVAAMVYAYLSKWTQPDGLYEDGPALLARIPERLRLLTEGAAARNLVDRDLALAVLVTELKQRPAWIRRLERATPATSKTHGPFQNLARASATDQESVEAAMQNLSNAILSRRDGGPRSGRLQAEIERHNRSDNFLAACESAFHAIAAESSPSSEATGRDGSPMLRCTSRTRRGHQWIVRGDFSEPGRDLFGVASVTTTPEDCEVSLREGPTRREWEARVSVDSSELSIGVRNEDDPTLPARQGESINVYLY
ncbi:hypothetical protein [Actinomycetospora aeridis]|uniref:Uncharacterized protein n=1 Tax=Actinomycetospora aeridis TaxID=3129231 RepID=A0ABU8N7P1_9PSEU